MTCSTLVKCIVQVVNSTNNSNIRYLQQHFLLQRYQELLANKNKPTGKNIAGKKAVTTHECIKVKSEV